MMGASGGMYLWIALWVVLGVAVAAAAAIVVARSLSGRQQQHHEVASASSRSVRDAQDALRQRYARGEISREEYLQGKIELED